MSTFLFRTVFLPGTREVRVVQRGKRIMGAVVTAVRKILNLPVPQQNLPTNSPAGHAEPEPAAGEPAGSPLTQQNPWIAAAQRLGKAPQGQDPGPAPAANGVRTGQAGGGTRPGKSASSIPWNVQDEKSGTLFARRFGRGLLWAVVALAAVTGVRSWFFPDHPAPAPAPVVRTGPDYPTAAAQSVVARWATAYLTWDEKNPTVRQKALAMDMPSDADTTLGWDGKGHQSVSQLYVGEVTVLQQGQARVHVEALVTAGGGAADQGNWLALDVPVAQAHGRIVVTGEPGIVGTDVSSVTVPTPKPAEPDTDMSEQTKGVISQFFTAYASGDTSTVAAPGANIPALPQGFTLSSVQDWNVDTGSGANRSGTAVVRWQTSGGTIEQTYRVVITRVASASAQRWQVSELHGGAY